jgi:acyl carrier protein
MGDSSKERIQEAIRDFLRDNFPLGQQQGLAMGDRLLEEGIVDSLGLLLIIEFIEGTYDVTVRDMDVVVANFETIAAIADFVLLLKDQKPDL